MWHISIPERRTHPLFFRYPFYRNSERNRSIRTTTPPPQRKTAITSAVSCSAARAIAMSAQLRRHACPIRISRTADRTFCKQSCIKTTQRNKNIILFRS